MYNVKSSHWSIEESVLFVFDWMEPSLFASLVTSVKLKHQYYSQTAFSWAPYFCHFNYNSVNLQHWHHPEKNSLLLPKVLPKSKLKYACIHISPLLMSVGTYFTFGMQGFAVLLLFFNAGISWIWISVGLNWGHLWFPAILLLIKPWIKAKHPNFAYFSKSLE